METPKLTPEIFKNALSALETKLNLTPNTGRVFRQKTFISDKIQFVKEYTVKTNNLTEVVFAQIEMARFTDVLGGGCADNPEVAVPFNITFFREFVQKRPDNSSSYEVFIAMLLNQRNEFLKSATERGALTEINPALPNNISHTALLAVSDIFTNENNPMFPGALGHWTILQTKVVFE